ncbi:MAG: ribosome small subunit-dependent GTPase A [Firmicutes bacterium]|nr:ribosome small subunit-dependent GTPase A [Bacillota bacterium]
MRLQDIGWDSGLESQFSEYAVPGYTPGRISAEFRDSYLLLSEAGEVRALLSGRFRHLADSGTDLPVTGDWVAFTRESGAGPAMIHAVLPRRSKFSRKQPGPGHTGEQVIAANIDAVFIVMALDRDFNVRRLERYLVLIWESGASPVVVLSKADLCDVATLTARTAAVESIAPGVPVHVVSNITGDGLSGLGVHLAPGRTVALLGSSGAGKSTLANRLLGANVQATGEVRKDDSRGRHTTSYSRLIRLPSGALLVDSPGLRELQLWASDDGLDDAFEDVATLARGCRFSDCRHESEPGCAVKQAVEAGTLDPGRYESYLRLRREVAFLNRKENIDSYLADKRRRKALSKAVKRLKKH